MKVFKFGGASISTLERIENTVSILEAYRDQPLLVIISAMGKTTNALEKVVDAFYSGERDQALQLFEQVKRQHLQMAKYLLVKQYLPTEQAMLNFFTEVEWLLYDQPVREYDYYYDQIVCAGELLATTLVSAYWNERNVSNTWLDVRDILRTDAHFRDANIDWSITAQKTAQQIQPVLESGGIVVTQGFVGATDENESTTLGREGSDFSAAIFANLLDASELIIWKDVPAVMNADPKTFPNVVPLPELNYEEVIEMAYYGAQVIHPKTIKPLQNKHIPLQVKSFLDPQAPGTRIHQQRIPKLPPIIVRKDNQVLLTFQSVDYSFVGEAPLAALYQLFAAENIRPNLTQNGAIRFLCCLDDKQTTLDTLIAGVAAWFDVQIERGLTLLTIRHGKEALVTELVGDRQIVLEQSSPETWQALLRG